MLNNQNYPLIDWQHHAATALPFTSLWVAGGQHELKLVHFEWGKETWETLLSDGDSDTDTHTDTDTQLPCIIGQVTAHPGIQDHPGMRAASR